MATLKQDMLDGRVVDERGEELAGFQRTITSKAEKQKSEGTRARSREMAAETKARRAEVEAKQKEIQEQMALLRKEGKLK